MYRMSIRSYLTVIRRRKLLNFATKLTVRTCSAMTCLRNPQPICFLNQCGLTYLKTLLIFKLFYCSSKDWRVRSLAIRSAVLWLLAVVFWTNDKFLCDSFWHKFPYLHSGWHILIFLSAYTACVLFAYFHVLQERPELDASLRWVMCVVCIFLYEQ